MRFNDMPLSDGTKDAVAAMGYEDTTPIQELAIQPLLDGKDVIGRARTGTGKTAAFGIPLVERLQSSRRGVRGLILVPTRELALQVTDVLKDIARASGIQVTPIFGGTGFAAQVNALKKPDTTIVVACPGRLLDLHGRGQINLSGVEVLVLDEADRMLDMGFVHDMRRIRRLIPDERQTSLFSATLDARVKEIAKEFTWPDAVTVEVPGSEAATPLTEQNLIHVEKADKQWALLHLLHQEQPGKAVVFTRTKHVAKRLAQKLNRCGWNSVALQGNMSQGQRERAMASFRAGKARLMVATDVAARGLDVADITHVINLDLPMEPEAYVHRIGRTGRNGQTGTSFTFVQSDEHKKLREVERIAGNKIPLATLDYQSEPSVGPDKGIAPEPQDEQPRRNHRPSSNAPRRSQGRNGGHGSGRNTGGPSGRRPRVQSSNQVHRGPRRN